METLSSAAEAYVGNMNDKEIKKLLGRDAFATKAKADAAKAADACHKEKSTTVISDVKKENNEQTNDKTDQHDQNDSPQGELPEEHIFYGNPYGFFNPLPGTMPTGPEHRPTLGDQSVFGYLHADISDDKIERIQSGELILMSVPKGHGLPTGRGLLEIVTRYYQMEESNHKRAYLAQLDVMRNEAYRAQLIAQMTSSTN